MFSLILLARICAGNAMPSSHSDLPAPIRTTATLQALFLNILLGSYIPDILFNNDIFHDSNRIDI